MLLLAATIARAEDRALLFVGNSYTQANNLEQVALALFVAGAECETAATRNATPGYTLPQHLADADGSNGDKPLRASLVTGGQTWTWVFLQDQSQIPGFPQNGAEYQASLASVPLLDGMVAGAGGQTVLLQTWGRRDGDELNPDRYPDYPTMQEHLAEGYAGYAAAITAEGRTGWIAPAGYGFRHVYQTDPEGLFPRLYIEDGSHPSPLGTYLVACVVYATVTGDRCSDLTPPDGLSAADAADLQAAADAAVFDESPDVLYPWSGGDPGEDCAGTGAGDTAAPADDSQDPGTAACGCAADGKSASILGGLLALAIGRRREGSCD